MIPGSRFVGRKDELDVFENALNRLSDKMGALILVSGRAGIGKTALCQEFLRIAQDNGAICASGNFPTFADRRPYWGWISLLRQLAGKASNGNAAELARALQNGEEFPGNTSQLLVLEKLRSVLADLSEDAPVVLTLDDIQNADFASLNILESLASELSGLRLILNTSFRDSDHDSSSTRGNAALSPILASNAQRIILRGIDQLESAELCKELTGWVPDAELVRRLHQQTEGNPLFLRQILIALLEQGHIVDGVANLPDRLTVPAGISEAIGARLDRISSDCRTALEQAAILGHSWQLAVLERIVPDFDPVTLDLAERVGLIRPTNLPLGQWQFTHALIREVLYDNIPAMRRLQAHAEAASAIEALFGENDPSAISALAYHTFEGQVFAGTRRVIELAQKAGRYAVSVAAYRDAAVHFRIALECFDVPGIDQPEAKIDAALELAEAERLAGENVDSIKTCRRALQWSRYRSDWPRYAKAALSYEAARWQPGLPSEEIVSCINFALTKSSEISAKDAVRLRYSLARALQRIGKVYEAAEEGRRAIAEARDIGDQLLLCDVLDQGLAAYCAMPGTVDERSALHTEHVHLARELGDKDRLATAIVNAGVCQGTSGELAVLREYQAELEDLASELGQPHYHYIAAQRASLLALHDGDFSRAVGLASNALRIGDQISGANVAGIYGIQMFLINRDKGVLGEFAQLLGRIEDTNGAKLWQPGQALLLTEIGELGRATSILDAIVAKGLDTLPIDDMRSITLAFLAEVVWIARAPTHARELYKLLKDQAGEAITLGPGAVCFGPVDRTLGLLQASMQNYDLARRHLESAMNLVKLWPSRPLTLRTACDFCEVLILEKTPSAIKRAGELCAELAHEASTAGMRDLARRFAAIDEELQRLASSHGYHELTAREVEVLRKLARGASNARISRDLGISHATVATHVRNILSKTASKNRTAAAAFARQEGLVGDRELS